MSGISGIETRLVEMFDSGAVFWLAVLVALGVGAAHALAPGHGKTITAAYLVGTRGRAQDAVRLGVIVALMHTLSVLVLALAWVGLTGFAAIGTERVTAWLQALAGLVVVAVGAHLVHRQVRDRAGHPHDHDHPHRHDHPHDHDHDRGHSNQRDQGHGRWPGGQAVTDHAVASGSVVVRDGEQTGRRHHHHHDEVAITDPWSRRGLVAIGLSGGLLPSPSAFLVLVSGLLTGRALDAVLLVGAFGLGMAGTLTVIGVVTVRGWAVVSGRARRWPPLAAAVAWTPTLAGLAVGAGGLLYLSIALGTAIG